jgi:hypothetical protein
MKHRKRTMRFAARSCGYPSLEQHEQRFAVSVMEGSRRTFQVRNALPAQNAPYYQPLLPKSISQSSRSHETS